MYHIIFLLICLYSMSCHADGDLSIDAYARRKKGKKPNPCKEVYSTCSYAWSAATSFGAARSDWTTMSCINGEFRANHWTSLKGQTGCNDGPPLRTYYVAAHCDCSKVMYFSYQRYEESDCPKNGTIDFIKQNQMIVFNEKKQRARICHGNPVGGCENFKNGGSETILKLTGCMSEDDEEDIMTAEEEKEYEEWEKRQFEMFYDYEMEEDDEEEEVLPAVLVEDMEMQNKSIKNIQQTMVTAGIPMVVLCIAALGYKCCMIKNNNENEYKALLNDV